ncbi:MAG: GntR family transcriptional regulator [Balneolaceae bacterium]
MMIKLKEGTPRHSQITQWLRKQIEEGHYTPEQKLPSENELAKRFDVSRVTIRRALQSLESDALIYRCQGLGSFVSDNRTPHNLVRLTDFQEDMSRAGFKATSIVKDVGQIKAPEWLAKQLQLETKTIIIQIDRLRLADGEPIAFDSTWLPMLYGQLIEPDKLEHSTIYNMLEKKYEIPIQRGCYQLTADLASATLAADLRIETGSPLLRIDRTSYTIGDKPVYFQKRYYRSDRVLYEMTLERDPSGQSGDMPLKEFIPIFRSTDVGHPHHS